MIAYGRSFSIEMHRRKTYLAFEMLEIIYNIKRVTNYKVSQFLYHCFIFNYLTLRYPSFVNVYLLILMPGSRVLVVVVTIFPS